MKHLIAAIIITIILANPHFVCAASPELDSVFCQALIKHVPDANVAYQAGVDVNGKPVVPADLPDNNAFQLQPISIPLTVDLLKTLNIPTGNFPLNNMARNDINLGMLTIDGDNVLYNGKPLTNEQQDNLAVLCMKPSHKKPMKLVPDGAKK